MKYIYLNALFLVFVFHTSCEGQNKTNPPQDNFSKGPNGISESQLKELDTSKVPIGQVRNIKQDRNGNILIAAGWSGVFRYDGKSFTNLTSKLGLPRFWDVLEDRRGNLWFASTDSGVYNYNGKSFQHFTTREGLANNAVMCIYEDKAGIIWFGTGGGGVSRYDGKSFRTFTTKEGHSNNDITTIIEDKTGKLWIGTRGEAFVYDGKTFTTLIHEGKAFNNVWSIIEDKKGNIWFGENGGRANGLWRYDGSVFTKVSQRVVYAVIEDKKGNLWTTGEINPNGKVWALSRYDQKSLYNKMPTLTEIKSGGRGDFLAILEANDGSIWFGALGGVHRYDGKTLTDFKSKEGQK
ncbi:histidine kinase [Pseudoflavitalea sp. X16]|uniref:ligand-binding sensor domain-containing protein n=1 Tax=Paraflavitalea devenefica TaxID=2716334 RepID=UPI0014248D72|nr:two-component regulator propeller domain-containing protein [Paraflavitalea devenefica]NII26476.1 histidine kinase [Paraflavitalea devenefica]